MYLEIKHSPVISWKQKHSHRWLVGNKHLGSPYQQYCLVFGSSDFIRTSEGWNDTLVLLTFLALLMSIFCIAYNLKILRAISLTECMCWRHATQRQPQQNTAGRQLIAHQGQTQHRILELDRERHEHPTGQYGSMALYGVSSGICWQSKHNELTTYLAI